MEQNLPVIAKKVWSLMRVMFFMLKKGISKTKFFADLNMMLKRGKIAGKALQNLLFHHHHNWAAATFHRHPPHHLPPGEYQFSCNNTPSYPLSFFSTHKKRHGKHHGIATAITNLPPPVDDIDGMLIDPAVMKMLEMLASATTSPAPPLPGFGLSPMVKQLRITDSPFPISNGDNDGQVDEAAEKFIMRFYNDLRRQK